MAQRLSRFIGIVGIFLVAASAARAYTLTSTDGSFSVEFPAAATFQKNTTETASGIPFDQYVWSLENKDGWWGAGMIVYSKPVAIDYRVDVENAVAASKRTLRSQKTIQQGGVQGREIIIDLPGSGGVVRQRFLRIHGRLYQIAFTDKAGAATTPDVDAFLAQRKMYSWA